MNQIPKGWHYNQLKNGGEAIIFSQVPYIYPMITSAEVIQMPNKASSNPEIMGAYYHYNPRGG
jgi:hypothetical protein